MTGSFGIFLAGFSLFAVLLSGCKSDPHEISEADLRELKKKYSAEVINYFYETVFHRDYGGVNNHGGKRRTLGKWQEDIRMRILGTGWKGDSAHVQSAIYQLNALQLPVHLRLTDDSTKSNLEIRFGDFKELAQIFENDSLVPFVGFGEVTQLPEGGLSATIAFANDATSYQNLDAADRDKLRQGIILEEITQALGVIGDSWKDYRSIFFEGRKKVTELQPLDKHVIQLLYEPSIPALYPIERFEAQFSDVLYNSDVKRKLVAYAKKNGISPRQLQHIRDNCYLDSLLIRYSGIVFVKIKGDYSREDLRFCEEAIALLNTVTDGFQLVYADDGPWHDLPCINIHFETRPDLTPTAERAVQIGGLMVNRRILGNLKIKSGKPGFTDAARHGMLFKAIYAMLGFDGVKEEVVERNDDGRLQFRPGHREALALLYNPVLIPEGLAKSDLEEVIRSLE